MPSYDVRCRACGTTFEVSRPMSRANDPAPCPQGHDDTVRLLPTVGVLRGATGGRATSGPAPARTASATASGGCCGGGCCG